jgi:hypothetical protein
VDIDEKDGNGKYIYPRSDNRALRPAYEPRNAQKQIIYNQPYPLYNFCVGFYYRLPKEANELEIITGINNPLSQKDDLRIVQSGSTVRIITSLPGAINLKLFDLTGRLLKDFGRQQRNEYSLSGLNRGIYIVSVNVDNHSKKQKIIIG